MTTRLLLAVLLTASLPQFAAARQSATEVLGNMADGWLTGIESIEDFTVTGESFTSQHKKFFDASGVPYFKNTTTDSFSGMQIGSMTTMFSADDWNELRTRIGDAATYRGMSETRGRPTHHLVLTDFSSMTPGDSGTDSPPDSVAFHIDPEGWLLARIEVFGSEANGDNVTPTIDFEDYQTVEGMRYPFLTRVTMVGLQVNVTQDQVNEAMAALAGLEDRLAALPAAQRDAIMARMQPQIEQMQQIAESGTVETVYRVTSISVNDNLPASLFN